MSDLFSSQELLHILVVPAAFCLDLLLGDPHWFPHPVRFIGSLIKGLERLLKPVKNRRSAGTFLTISVVSVTFFASWVLSSLHPVINLFLAYTILATNSLAKEAMKVHKQVKKGDLPEARRALSFLVSRDTQNMTENEVIKGTVETVAENIVDGIIAPLFFLFIGGVPLAMAYKAINTLDSMVGYKNEKYRDLGRSSARLDDTANFLPARLAGFLLIPIGALFSGFDFKGAIRTVKTDRLKHSSPNSGHPEAAVAGALGIKLGGPAVYFGKRTEKPFIGEEKNILSEKTIVQTIKIMLVSSIIFLFIYLLFSTLWITIRENLLPWSI